MIIKYFLFYLLNNLSQNQIIFINIYFKINLFDVQVSISIFSVNVESMIGLIIAGYIERVIIQNGNVDIHVSW
jgi:hypothetical protein